MTQRSFKDTFGFAILTIDFYTEGYLYMVSSRLCYHSSPAPPEVLHDGVLYAKSKMWKVTPLRAHSASVIQPWLASCTNFAYFPNVPLLTLGSILPSPTSHFSFLTTNTSGSTKRFSSLLSASISITSPSSTSAIDPPSIASGTIAPIKTP